MIIIKLSNIQWMQYSVIAVDEGFLPDIFYFGVPGFDFVEATALARKEVENLFGAKVISYSVEEFIPDARPRMTKKIAVQLLDELIQSYSICLLQDTEFKAYRQNRSIILKYLCGDSDEDDV
jgi:hypothetical protein